MNEGSVRLLRATLQARATADPSPDCLDAETVAAWADDTLGRDERRAAEAHAADCGRCQALVAAMAHTAPLQTERPWWRVPVMGWLVPLTAAAAALLVWLIVPGTPPGPSARLVSDATVHEPPSSQAAASIEPPDISLPPPAAAPGAAQGSSRRETQAARGGAGRSAVKGKSATGAMEKARVENTSVKNAPVEKVPVEKVPEEKVLSGVTAGPAPPAPSLPSTTVPAEPRPGDADRSTAGPPVSGPRTAAAQVELANARTLLLDARRIPTVIASTNPASQWRILPDGGVQHSTDGGTTWEVQPTGVTVRLTAGASPAPSICWLVGPQGIVLLSTDGRSWRRIAFPESADLAAVRATDDRSATVSASDGRAFSTTDGGETWTR